MTEQHPLLMQEYRDLLRAVGHEHLLDSAEPPDLEQDIRSILSEARKSEVKEGTGLGFLGERNEEELLAALRARLANERGLAFPLKLIYQEVLRASGEYGLAAPCPIMFGQFPTGSFNAQAVRVEHGALLLINTGLMMLIYQCSTLIARSFGIAVEDDDTSETKARLAPQLTHEELVSSLAQAVIAYLLTGSSTSVPRTAFDSGVHRMLATLLAKSADRFVVGHELGHVIAGHLSELRTVRRATRVPGFSLDMLQKSWEQEIEADIYGIRFLLPPSERVVATNVDFQKLSFSITGPYLFFGLDDLLTSIHLRLKGEDREILLASDHPPSEIRMEAVTMFLKQMGAEEAMEFPLFVREWFSSLAAEVCDHVIDKIESITSVRLEVE